MLEPTHHLDFVEFNENEAIKNLRQKLRWTVSDPTDKKPLDMRAFIDKKVAYGAKYRDDRCLTTLDEIYEHIPNVSNVAFWLDARIDRIMVIDIEKTCPPEIAQRLLNLDEIIYSEVSLSGKGYHLVMPMPGNIDDFPDAKLKSVLREDHGYFEILINHYVTFTRRPIPAHKYNPDAPVAYWDKVYASLATRVRQQGTEDIDINQEKPDIPYADEIIDDVMDQLEKKPYGKSLADFHYDHSRYEFGYAGFLYFRVKTAIFHQHRKARSATNATTHNGIPRIINGVLQKPQYENINYSDSDIAWLIYLTITENNLIEHRAKHDEFRDGLPLLLKQASSVVALQNAQKDDES